MANLPIRLRALVDTFFEEDEMFEDEEWSDDELLSKLNYILTIDKPKERTLTNRYSLLKKYLRESYQDFMDDDIYRRLKPPDEITKKVVKMDTDVRIARTNIDFNQELVDKILSNITKDKIKFEDLAILLQFVSGRRVNEIGSRDYDFKSYNNVLKMKLSKCYTDCVDGKSVFKDIKLIPNTLSVSKFKELLKKLRKYTDGVSSQNWTRRLNKYIKIHYRQDLSTHNLRGMYAMYFYEKYNPENLNLLGFIKNILNHKTGDGEKEGASINYAKYKFTS